MVSTDIAWLQQDHDWPGLTAVGKVVRVREMADKTTTETAYYLLSMPITPEQFGEVVRSHWGVENRLHWCLDVTMNEDHMRNRMDNGPQNLAILRHMALNRVSQGKLEGFTAKEAQARRLERRLPGQGAGSTLKCDYPGPEVRHYERWYESFKDRYANNLRDGRSIDVGTRITF